MQGKELVFFLMNQNMCSLFKKHNISLLPVNNLTFRWNAARGAINSTLSKRGDRSIENSAGSAHMEK